MPSEYPEFLKNSLFSRIGQIAWIRCVSLDSIALKSMWELYINSISSDIDGERCASDLAGGEACASRWVWRSVGIDDRSRGSRNHENHKKHDFSTWNRFSRNRSKCYYGLLPSFSHPSRTRKCLYRSLECLGWHHLEAWLGWEKLHKSQKIIKNHKKSWFFEPKSIFEWCHPGHSSAR